MPARKIAQDAREAPPQLVVPQPPTNGAVATSVNGAAADTSTESFTAPLPSTSVLDDFNVEDFRADSFAPVSQPVTDSRAVLVMKPKSLLAVYIHPAWRMGIYLRPAESGKRDAHLVLPNVARSCPKLCRWYMARAYADQDGNFYLWPIPLENKLGKPNSFVDSAYRAIDLSVGKWCHFETNMTTKVYEVHEMDDHPPAPNWPDGGIEFLVKLAFRDRIIRDVNHPHLTLRSHRIG